MKNLVHVAQALLLAAPALVPALASSAEITNTIGMRLVRVDPGTFTMGFSGDKLPTSVAVAAWRAGGDFDERPAHTVRITTGFYMGAYEVTNAQYEQFDPSHRTLRGKLGFSKEDNEAVVFVNWQDASRFCQW